MSTLMKFPLLVFVLSFCVLWLSVRIGDSFRKKGQKLEDDAREDLGVILAATLTLLGLIIGFSFSMAISRYDQRKNFEEEEANAIGTEYLRADLLPVADAQRIRTLLASYHEQRISFYKTRDQQRLDRVNADTAQLQAELWSAVRGPGHCTAVTRDGFGRFGYDRCIEYAGIHAGCVVEPYPGFGMGPYDSDCDL